MLGQLYCWCWAASDCVFVCFAFSCSFSCSLSLLRCSLSPGPSSLYSVVLSLWHLSLLLWVEMVSIIFLIRMLILLNFLCIIQNKDGHTVHFKFHRTASVGVCVEGKRYGR